MMRASTAIVKAAHLDAHVARRALPPSAPRTGERPRQAKTFNALSSREIIRFRRALLRWYERNRRALPWRETRDPYRVWLSEIMLQQTRVAAVLDHYRSFLKLFPDVQALAAASEDAVLAAWSGLGYYRRARMLHRCARQIAVGSSGAFPRNAAALLALPGIGRYTAAAIASIAFDEPVAVVDSNVERVLKRFTGIDLATQQVWRHAQELLYEPRPGDHNQAIMELGATVCQPRAPRCPACPIRKLCATNRSSRALVPVTTNERSASSPRPTKPSSSHRQAKKNIWCLLNQRNGKILLVKRPEKASLMAGMWELPQSAGPPQRLPALEPWRTFRHSITVTDYRVHVFRTPAGIIPAHHRQEGLRARSQRKVPSLPPQQARAKWIAIDRIPQIPVTGLTRKILKASGLI